MTNKTNKIQGVYLFSMINCNSTQSHGPSILICGYVCERSPVKLLYVVFTDYKKKFRNWGPKMKSIK